MGSGQKIVGEGVNIFKGGVINPFKKEEKGGARSSKKKVREPKKRGRRGRK